MRATIRWTILIMITACGGGNPTGATVAPGLSASVAANSGGEAVFAAGVAIPAIFHNRSGGVAGVGALDCTADLEQFQPADSTWQRLVSLRTCIMPLILVPNGRDFRFTTLPPDGPGRYRIVFNATLDDHRDVPVRSNPFEIR